MESPHRFYQKELDKKSDPLDGLVQQLQKRNLNTANHLNPINNATPASDEKQLNEQHQELDLFFHLIMQQVHVAAEQEERLLAGRLVTLENVEKQFGSLLLTQMGALQARIRSLETQQSKLQSLIDRHRGSIFGFLLFGIKSRFQLRSVRSQLKTLYVQYDELNETNKTFQYARRALLQSRKEKAVNLLERMRRERVGQVGALLFDSMQEWLSKALNQNKFLGFCVEAASVHGALPPEGFFGIFKAPLAAKEREWIERICRLHGPPMSELEATQEEIRRHIAQFLEEKSPDPTYNLANHLLLLTRLLHLREGLNEEVNVHVLPLYKLWTQSLEKGPPSYEMWQEIWEQGGQTIKSRLSAIIRLTQGIETLHEQQAIAAGKKLESDHLRLMLSRLFRPFVWKCETLSSLIPKETPFLHRKAWQDELSHRCDTAFAAWLGLARGREK